MEHPNAAIARTIYDSFNERDFDRGLTVFADEAIWEDVPTNTTFRGPAEFRRNYEQWFTKFPDGRCEVVRLVATDDCVFAECVDHGTNLGPLETPFGTFAATGRQIELPFCDVLEIAGGKIVRGRSYFNFATLMSQLGINLQAASAP